jgi:hypothetical protein
VDAKPTIAEMMAAYAQDAVDHGKSSSDVTLDFSVESIRRVEEILEKLHAASPRGFFGRLFGRGPSAQDVSLVCKMYGGYVGEVIRKAGGGEWVFDTEIVPGENTISLRKGDQRIFPPAKIYKRLTNGSEDNIWVYSQVLLKDWK